MPGRALKALRRQIKNLAELNAAYATRIREALSDVLKPVHLRPMGEYLIGAMSFDGNSTYFGKKIGLVAGAGFEPATPSFGG